MKAFLNPSSKLKVKFVVNSDEKKELEAELFKVTF